MGFFPLVPLVVLPIAYRSYQIPYTEWVTLFTLCLAPLIAHILSGVPRTSHLCHTRPNWHQRITHYNPTSILWRYAAIADRRIRANAWDKADLAAANTLFWTTEGWDGSEAMVPTTIPYISHLPSDSRIAVFSKESLKTLIVTLQGLQASILLIRVLLPYEGPAGFTIWLGLDSIFFPLAFIGLLRLASGLWLTDDFAYSAPRGEKHYLTGEKLTTTASWTSPHDAVAEVHSHHRDEARERYRKPSFWPARVFRAFFLLPILGIWTVTLLYLPIANHLTATAFLCLLFHCILLGCTTIIIAVYFARDGTASTIIPCISAVWYKVYTVFILSLMLALITVACVETHRTSCGKYSSGPDYLAEVNACYTNDGPPTLVGAPPGSQDDELPPEYSAFGLATRFGNETDPGSFTVFNFTGTCLGAPVYGSSRLVSLEANASAPLHPS